MRAAPEPPTPRTGTFTRSGRRRRGNLLRRAAGAVDRGLATAGPLLAQLPGTARATRVRANATTSALQLMPDSTLQRLAASSIGLGAGFYLAGLPRLVTVAALTPAMIIGAAIALRPTEPPARPGTTA
jgi:hypothetical protein